MGNLNQKIARIDVLIGGRDQARKHTEEMRKQWSELGKTVAEAKKKMEESTDTVDYDKNKKRFEEAMREQKQMSKAIQETERNINTVEKYLSDVSGQTLRNLNQGKKALSQMLLGINPQNLKSIDTVRDYIKQIGDEAQRRKGSLVEFSDVIGDIGNVSDKSLSMAKQRLQDLLASTKLNSQEISKYREELSKVATEEQRRVGAKAGAVMGNLQESTLTEIQEAIKATEGLRSAQKVGSQEWEIYSEEIKRAQTFLEDYNKLEQSVAMDDRMKRLGTISSNSLVEIKKFWQEQVDGAQRGSVELSDYQNRLNLVIQEEQRRKKDSAGAIMSNLMGSSVADIKSAISSTEELRNAQTRGSSAWSLYNAQIEKAKEYLKSYDDEAKKLSVEKQMQNISTISSDGMSEVKKYWQEMVNGALLGTQELKNYQDQLAQVEAEEKRRISTKAQTTLGKVQGGTFSGTISETKDAIKELEQFKLQLKTSDVTGIKQVDDAIALLNANLKQASVAALSYDQAIEQAAQVKSGDFQGTYEDLKRLKKTLQEYKAQLQVGDTRGLDQIQDAFRSIEEAERKAKEQAVDINYVMNNLKTVPMNDLKLAAQKLQEELNDATQGTREFITQSAQLRQVNAQIEQVNKSWKEQDSSIKRVIKQIGAYALAYVGLSEVYNRIKQLTQANLGLSDSLGDIQKSTGLSAEAVAELSRQIDSIDTRESQKSLHDLAYEAGKIGLVSKQDIFEFVEAGNEVITALGDELGGAQAITGLMKINGLLGETEKLGVGKALKATGSAINSLSNASSAAAGPIADIISRIGSVGQVSKLSMADMAALGATADELSQEVEVSGTALSKFITAMQTNTEGIAKAVGVNEKELEDLMTAGKTMEAMILVLQRMKDASREGGMKEIAPLMKEFGSDGERLNRVITAFATNVDTLQERVNLSRTAFEEATSVTNEYNIMNETAMGLVLRLGNMIMETFVNSGFVASIKSFLLVLIEIPKWIERNYTLFVMITSAITGLTVALIANQIQWLKNLNAMKAVDVYTKLKAAVMAVGVAMRSGATYTALMTKAVNGLKAALTKNWLTMLIGLVAAVGVAVYNVATKMSEAAKATKDYNKSIQAETTNVSILFDNLKKAKQGTEEYKNAKEAILSRYGEYLKGLGKEIESLQDVDAAYRAIIISATKAAKARAIETGMQGAVDVYAEKTADAYENIYNSLVKIGGYTKGQATSITNSIRTFVEAGKELPKELQDVVNKMTTTYVQSSTYGSTGQEIKTNVVQAQIGSIKQAKKELDKEREELEIRYGSIVDVIKDGNKSVTKEFADGGKPLNVWGEALTFEEKSAAQLIEEYKRLNKERNSMKEDADYSKVYGGQYKNRTEALKAFMAELTKIKTRLKDEFGVDLSGNPIKEKTPGGRKVTFGGTTKTEKEINEEYTAAISALEAYYNKEKEITTRAYVGQQITEEEKNRQLLKKEEAFLTDRIALRRKLLGKAGGERFDQSKYVQTNAETGETTDYFKGKNLAQLQGFINKMGQRMTDGMLEKLTDDELLIMQKAAEHMAKIQKIILDNDFTGQVEKQYQDELEVLELFWGKEEDVTVEAGEKRLAYLRMLSKDSYDMDSAGLQERMSKYGEFGEWMKGRTTEDYQALLLMLQKFYDDTEEAENKELERKKRIANKGWEKSGQKASWNETDVKDKANVDFMGNLKDVGLASDRMVDDAEIQMYQNRLSAAQAYYDYMLQAGADTTDAEQKRNEALMELSNKEVEITKSKLQTLKDYTDAVVDFSAQMGEAAFGEVKDRQEAGKQLLRTAMQLTKNLIMEKVKELLMKKALGMQDVGITQATESTKSVIQGTGAITDLTVQGAKTAGDVALGAASGGAKTIGQLGWWGIPLIAVIGAALSALMGMAMGKMNKAKEEIASTTGASNKGRVAAGMLTYADGDYPVLGNDGKVYNASYQKDLKTGVYGGGAHFGIFSEKKPEMIVDGDTTQRIMLNYPQVYESILTIARNGRLKSSMPTYADGNLSSMPAVASTAGINPGAIDGSNAQMMEMMANVGETLSALNARLQQPINAVVDPYGTKGGVNSLNKATKFMQKRNLIKG